MDRPLSHDEISGLLGAYALDAADAEEAAVIARHLEECPRCAAEVAEHHEVAGYIANAGGDAPAELWDRIAERIERARPGERLPAPLALVSSSADAGPGWRWRRRQRRAAWAAAGTVAAGAAAAIAVLAVQVGRLDTQVGQLSADSVRAGLTRAALAVIVDPHAQRVTLTASAGQGQAVAELVILPDGSAFALNSHLAGLRGDRTYQLWGFVRGQPVSLGLLGRQPGDVPFTVDPSVHITSFAVTDEAGGGSPHPTGAPAAESGAT